MFAKVALPVPHFDYFTYQIPIDVAGLVTPGMLVTVPFRNQAAIGVVLEICEESDISNEYIKEIIGVCDPELQAPSNILKLALYVSNQYLAPPGMVFKSILPPGTLIRRKQYFYPGINQNLANLDGSLRNFVLTISERPGQYTYSDLRNFEGVMRSDVDELIRIGLISVSPFREHLTKIPRGKERWLRAKGESASPNLKEGSSSKALFEILLKIKDGISIKALQTQGISPSARETLIRHSLAEYFYQDKEFVESGGLKSLGKENAVELTLWQESALQRIVSSIDTGLNKGFLLYGVTSSGKTQVYLEATKHTLARGKSVLVLVPEISLTPQIIERFERFLGISPLVWHSHLSPTDRLLVFKSAKAGKCRLVIGARSAIFAPLQDLGLIVIDEEQDHSYKQDDPAPRYNARDVALERGNIDNATVLLGSATPSVESYYRSKIGELELLSLPQRVAGKGNPNIEVISTAFKTEPTAGKPTIFPRGFRPLSEPLYRELSIRLKKKEQAIILLNRRGYASAVLCFECGWLGKCPDCEIGWTYHKTQDRMICHFCGRSEKGPLACERCGSTRLSFRSAGTQRLEETLKRLLPDAKTIRLDSDVAGKKWGSRDILDAFGRGKYRILLGTQMVAKGHHFPRVGFVAVISADIGLSLPDFRASERVLQLLTQAAGRAGRSSKKGDPGMVMVQTFSPDDPVFSYLKAHDFVGFLEDEIKMRQALGYPPFKRLILLVVSATDNSRAKESAESLKNEISPVAIREDMEILGPAESPILKRGKLFRYQLLLKISHDAAPKEFLGVLNDFMKSSRGIDIRVDVDPVSFM
jgi:primosomal protein N' (replication factor Y)